MDAVNSHWLCEFYCIVLRSLGIRAEESVWTELYGANEVDRLNHSDYEMSLLNRESPLLQFSWVSNYVRVIIAGRTKLCCMNLYLTLGLSVVLQISSNRTHITLNGFPIELSFIAHCPLPHNIRITYGMGFTLHCRSHQLSLETTDRIRNRSKEKKPISIKIISPDLPSPKKLGSIRCWNGWQKSSSQQKNKDNQIIQFISIFRFLFFFPWVLNWLLLLLCGFARDLMFSVLLNFPFS